MDIRKAATCADNCGSGSILTMLGLATVTSKADWSLAMNPCISNSLPVSLSMTSLRSRNLSPSKKLLTSINFLTCPTEPIHRNRDIARSFTSIASDFRRYPMS